MRILVQGGGSAVRVTKQFCWFLVGVGAISAAAIAQSDKSYVEDVKSKLTYEVSHLEGQQYRKDRDEIIGVLARGDTKKVPLKLAANVSYVFIAACDKDCDHAQIALLNS